MRSVSTSHKCWVPHPFHSLTVKWVGSLKSQPAPVHQQQVPSTKKSSNRRSTGRNRRLSLQQEVQWSSVPRYLTAQQFGRTMRLSLWAWLFWGLPIFLVLELGPFLIIGYGLKKTVGQLVGPYLAFAVPAVILMSLVWWLRVWEEQGTSPKRLARGWGMSVALWGVSVLVATTYSGVKLRLIDPMDALVCFVGSVLLSVPIAYFMLYYMAITRLSSRSAAKIAGRPPQH